MFTQTDWENSLLDAHLGNQPDEYTRETELEAGVEMVKLGKIWVCREIETGLFISFKQYDRACQRVL